MTITLDEERKAAMAGNLLVVLCGSHDAPAGGELRQPVFVNGQIEYRLSESVRQRKKDGTYAGGEIDVPPDLDIK